MVAVDAGGVAGPNQVEALPVQLLERNVTALEMVEDSEFHFQGRPSRHAQSVRRFGE